MSLANKLFEMVNDEPVFTPVLINLPVFKKLYAKDKSDTKKKYAKDFAFIWYFCDPKSPFRDSQDRIGDAYFAAYGTRNVTIPKELQDCIDEYILRQSTAETRSLDSSLRVCDNLINTLKKSEEDTSEYLRLIKDLDNQMKEIDDLDDRITLAESKLKLEKALADKTKDSADLIPKITKLVESLLDLRTRVKKSVEDLENDNTNAIQNFIIYDIISKYRK